MDVYNPVRVYADKSVRYDARPNVPGQTQWPRGLACDTRSHGSQSLAVRIRTRFAIARAHCRTRLLSHEGRVVAHAATQACQQNGRDDRGRVVVEN